MQCGECLGVCDYYSVFPEERKADEEAARKNDEAKQQREVEAEARRRENEEKERAHKEELDNKRRAEERKQRDMQLDEELEKLKRKMQDK